MEITLHPFVEQILECAARLTPDNAQRRLALEQATQVGTDLFRVTDERGQEEALVSLVSRPDGPSRTGRRPAAPSMPSQSKRAMATGAANGKVAFPPGVLRILECAAALTPDNVRRRWALSCAYTYGEQVFFRDAMATGQASRIGSPHGPPTKATLTRR